MKLLFTGRAAEDLEAIHAYLAASSPTGARNVQRAMSRTFENLVLFPNSGRRQSREGVRKLGVPRYPYCIFYTVDERSEEIIVLTVQHNARKPEFKDA